MLDWKDHSCCSSLTAIRRAAQTYVEIKTPLPLDSGILIMYWESALREWFLLLDLCLLRCWATDLSTSTLAQSYPFLNPGYRQVCVNFGYQDFWRLKIISNEKGLVFLLLTRMKTCCWQQEILSLANIFHTEGIMVNYRVLFVYEKF